MPKEIEKKYLVETIDFDLKNFNKKEIIQGYITSINDETEVRLRKKSKDYFLTVKTGSGLTRNETETKILKDQFEKLWDEAKRRKIIKTRYEIPYKSYLIELDIFKENLEGLIIAEIEFENEKEAKDFIPPNWFKKDLTLDERYKNKNLAIKGLD